MLIGPQDAAHDVLLPGPQPQRFAGIRAGRDGQQLNPGNRPVRPVWNALDLLQDAQLGCRGERPALRPWREFGRRDRRCRDGLWIAAFSDASSVRQIGWAIVVGHNHDVGLLCPSLNSKGAGVSSSLAQRARRLYERIYCVRGEMENRIKECQLDLFADRTSAATMRANQVRLWFASFAYVLLCALRRIGLAFTQFARASCGNIRLKLLKIGALVKISVRRVHVAMASACPYQHEFALAHALLRRAGA